MTRDLSRLLRPRHVAVVGGGEWARAVITQCRALGFAGEIWPVHPREATLCGLPAFANVYALPGAPDAAWIGVNRAATVDIVAALVRRGAGGAVCFASGFSETGDGADLNARLLSAAGAMPVLGPNCYGFINYLDRVALWPDHHGGQAAERGVAIITQSSNIALNLTSQQRGLPIAYLMTAGNQAQTGVAAIGMAMLEDARVTALGLHIEGFGNLRAFEALADRARALGKPVVVIKAGRSAMAQAAALSHTASLAGGDAGAAALLSRLGFARVTTPEEFIETLKLLHTLGPLPAPTLASMSCSGGEASLMADIAEDYGVTFPALTGGQRTGLHEALGDRVALANPLDYHTYVWRDAPAMTAAYAAMMTGPQALTALVLDLPRADRCDATDWDIAIDAFIAAQARTGARAAVCATLPELLPEPVCEKLLAAGIAPMQGAAAFFSAVEAAATPIPAGACPPVLLPAPASDARLIDEGEAKARLAAHGLPVPQSVRAASHDDAAHAAEAIGFPVVLKGEGIAHKTEAGAVVLGLTDAQSVYAAAASMPCDSFLVEAMVHDRVAEMLVGVVRDPAHGYVMTLAAGGVLTELLEDRQSFLLPATDAMIGAALDRLRISRILSGYRGGPAADRAAILRAIRAVQAYVMAEATGLEEIEVNPLICGARGAVAVDILLRREDTP